MSELQHLDTFVPSLHDREAPRSPAVLRRPALPS